MKTIKQILAESPRSPLKVNPADTVLTALEVMAKNNVGALLVMEGERLAGIFSERDYARKVILQGKSSRETPVGDVMTSKVFYCNPNQTFDQAMAIMSDKHIRHLPVLEDDKAVVGVISIGDMIKETIAHQEFVIKQLEQYIAG